MLNKIKYPALNAKMKGMYAKELTEEELDELLRQHNLKDAILFLKMKFSSLDRINENMNRREIEQELNSLFIGNILKISKYLNKKELEIFKTFLLKYEIDLVKNVFRNLTTNRDSKIYLKNIDNWTERLFTGIRNINNVTTEKDFFDIIKGQDYYYIFEKYQNSINLIPIEELEIKLDNYYFEKIYSIAREYNKELEDMVGTEIDLLNISIIYRANAFFKYTYLYNIYKKYFKEKLFNICTVFCNINLIDIEIKNIINIIEGIRYSIDKSEIQKKIVV